MRLPNDLFRPIRERFTWFYGRETRGYDFRKNMRMKMRRKVRRRVQKLFLLFSVFVMALGLANIGVSANVPTIALGTLQVDEYYDQLREAFYLEDYYLAGACNGWVQNVLNRSGLVPELVVDGTTVLELNDALAASECYDLVATREGGQSDYQEATNQMIEDVNAGKIRAGDIVIYTKNMNNYEGTGGPHWLHAAIVMKEKFTGTVENYKNYWLKRWKENYWGYPTIAHALAPDFGVEYYSPLTSPSSKEAADDGSTGYYVYRINMEKAKEALEKATATETETETEEASSTEAVSTEQIVGTTSAPVTQPTTQADNGIAEKSSAENMSQGSAAPGGSTGTGRFMNGVSILLTILAAILLFLCILVL